MATDTNTDFVKAHSAKLGEYVEAKSVIMKKQSNQQYMDIVQASFSLDSYAAHTLTHTQTHKLDVKQDLSGEVIPEGVEEEDMLLNFGDTNLYFLSNIRNAVMMFVPLLRFLPGHTDAIGSALTTARGKTLNTTLLHRRKPTSQESHVVSATCCLMLRKRRNTTWSLLSSTILLLLHHPEFQDRLAKELQAIAKQGEEVTSGDKVKSPLMEALELETNRLIVVILAPLARKARKDVEYKGYTIN
ncbi:hypothetical protein MAR_030573 [Mya arenaria]|uniref:Cytochrome P450 n=1 Tax=Mya arenaria TaxID=6604 RepID=A0ABY7F595_MYAAR|nr:hypothetical protein MAR_030573 [Mya arenaria]